MMSAILEYQYIVSEKLKINHDFFKEHEETILERLVAAHDEMTKTPRSNDCFSQHKIFGINQCIHLASSLVLLGSKADDLRGALSHVRENKISGDPTTVLTIATLDYLLNDFLIKERTIRDDFKPPKNMELESFKNCIETIRNYFSEVNWMIGSDGYRKLQAEHK